MTRPLQWLHLSDLHLGCRGRELWWQVREEFETSVRSVVQYLGVPDLVLITGDLTHQGASSEYELVDNFLEALLAWIGEGYDGPEPLILTIPGNHDLNRPRGRAEFQYRVLEKYGSGPSEDVAILDRELWESRDTSFVDPLFLEYDAWFKRRIAPSITYRAISFTQSHFPGDFCIELDLPGRHLPVAIVGLNSAWQQYRAAEFEGRLVIPAQQFHAALSQDESHSPLEVFKRSPRALLMMHHPPLWLAARGRQIFFESIYAPNRFDLCLYGHLHRGRSEEIMVAGGPRRCYFQSPSLFGLEQYGSDLEVRAIGYSWGSLSQDGTVRVWPMRRVTRSGGEAAFVHDSDFVENPAGGGVVIGGGSRPADAKLSYRLLAWDFETPLRGAGITELWTSIGGALQQIITTTELDSAVVFSSTDVSYLTRTAFAPVTLKASEFIGFSAVGEFDALEQESAGLQLPQSSGRFSWLSSDQLLGTPGATLFGRVMPGGVLTIIGFGYQSFRSVSSKGQLLARAAERIFELLANAFRALELDAVLVESGHLLGRAIARVRSGTDVLKEVFPATSQEDSLYGRALWAIESGALELELIRENFYSFQIKQVGSSALPGRRGRRSDRGVDSEVVDVTEVLRDMQSFFERSAVECNRRLEYKLDQVPALIAGPRQAFRLVLLNLFDNATKFSYESTTVSISVVVYSTSCVVEFQNLGVGVAPDEQARVFQPRFRSRFKNPDVRNEGLGLGLSYCRRVVEESFGGKITLTSIPQRTDRPRRFEGDHWLTVISLRLPRSRTGEELDG